METMVHPKEDQKYTDPGIQDREYRLDDPVVVIGVGILFILFIIGVVNGIVGALTGF